MVNSVSCCCVHGSWLYSNLITISNDKGLATWRRLGNVRKLITALNVVLTVLVSKFSSSFSYSFGSYTKSFIFGF